MIDPVRERLLDFREATSWLPKRAGGKRIHVSTLYRWTTHGSRGIRLETVRVGGRTCTSVEALGRFITASTESSPKETEADHD